jgi:hypothetical protein
MDEGIFSPLHHGVIMVEGFYNLRNNKFVVGRTNHVLWTLRYEDFNDVDKIDSRIGEVGDDETYRLI